MQYRLSTLLLVACIFASLLSLALRAWEVAELRAELKQAREEAAYFEREYERLRFTRWPDADSNQDG